MRKIQQPPAQKFVEEEVADIVFRGKLVPQRPADAHDILGTYRIVANSEEMSRVPDTTDELTALLKSRHVTLLAGRPERQPGRFKEEVNRARLGNYERFVKK